MAIETAERAIHDTLDQFANPKHSSTTCTAGTNQHPLFCSVRFLLDTIRARRPLRLKTKDGILMSERWCHSSAHPKCWGDWAPGGTYHLDGKPGCSCWKIKWLAPFRLRSFRKHGLWFEAMQFFYSFQSVHLVWICFVTDRSPITSNFIVLRLCTKFSPRWFLKMVSIPGLVAEIFGIL